MRDIFSVHVGGTKKTVHALYALEHRIAKNCLNVTLVSSRAPSVNSVLKDINDCLSKLAFPKLEHYADILWAM